VFGLWYGSRGARPPPPPHPPPTPPHPLPVPASSPPSAPTPPCRRGDFDFKGKSRAEVSGARITVWYEEEDKNNRKVSQSVRVARKVGR
jgi:hypothetical protein